MSGLNKSAQKFFAQKKAGDCCVFGVITDKLLTPLALHLLPSRLTKQHMAYI
jgi:hypothetical protein